MQKFAWADRTQRERQKHNTEHRPSTRFLADQLTNDEIKIIKFCGNEKLRNPKYLKNSSQCMQILKISSCAPKPFVSSFLCKSEIFEDRSFSSKHKLCLLFKLNTIPILFLFFFRPISKKNSVCSIVSPNAGRFLKFSDHLDEKKGYEFRIVTKQ